MKEEDYKKIDQYLQGELPKEENALFQSRLSEDQEFAAAFEIRQQMTNYLQASLQQPALEAKMEEFGKQYFKESTPSSGKRVKMPFLRIGLAIAAAIALLLMVWNPFNSVNLYTQYAAAHPPLALVEKNAATNLAQKAEQAYANKEYENAYIALSEIIQTEPNNVQASLALGISALESGRINEAQSIFNNLANGSSILKSYGQWYLALSYLKTDENEKAKSILETLDNNEPALKKKATELLKKL